MARNDATDSKDLPALRRVTVRGHDVPVSVTGEPETQPPLLMINGVGAEVPLWGEFRTGLTRQTIAFDVAAAHLGWRPSLKTYADFVNEVLAALQVPMVDVLGFSWGGMAAQEFTRRHSTRVRRLVLAATTPGYLSVPGRPSSLRTLLSPNRSEEKTLKAASTFYAGDIATNPQLLIDLGLVREVNARVYRRQLAACYGWTSAHWLRSIRQEALILHGSDDPIIPAINARLMAQLIPNSTLRIAERGGHLFVLTRAQETAKTVSDFLDQPEHTHG